MGIGNPHGQRALAHKGMFAAAHGPFKPKCMELPDELSAGNRPKHGRNGAG
jgi:hypothetical protein